MRGLETRVQYADWRLASATIPPETAILLATNQKPLALQV
jgi:hypothetical protein